MTLNAHGESYTPTEKTGSILKNLSPVFVTTKEQQIEAMAKRFTAHGLSAEEVRQLSLWETDKKGRVRDTKPKTDKQKKKARSKIQQQSRRKNRK